MAAPVSKGTELLPRIAWRELLWLALIVALIHAVCLGRYGFFRDELYYLACAKRLDWGFVDQPPLCVFVLKAWTSIFGDSLATVRVPMVLAGSASCIGVGLIARELGGDRRAQILASLAYLAAPVYMVVNHLYAMNGFDVLLWVAAIWIACRLEREPKLAIWLAFGAVIGLGLMNKLSIIWLVSGFGVAVVGTPWRRYLRTPGPYLAAGLSLIIWAPYLVWSYQHGNPTKEFVENALKYKLLPVPAWEFLIVQVVVTNPVGALMWVLGLYTAWREPRYRPYAIAFTFVLALLLLNGKARENYLSPAYPLVLGIGSIALVEWFKERLFWYRCYFGALALSGLFCSAFALPLLPMSVLESVIAVLPNKPPSAERGETSKLMGFSDMVGWPQMALTVEQIWRQQPDPALVPVLGMNYGESAAIEHFARDQGLNVIGRHNNYWLWGPGDWDGNRLIVIGNLTPQFEAMFTDHEMVARLYQPDAVPEEARAPIWVMKGLRMPVAEFWKKVKLFQ